MNKVTKKYNYIQFPLCLLQGTYQESDKALNIILDFGLVNYAKKISYDIAEVARQLMYSYYRNEDIIQANLYNTIQQFIDNESLTIDEDYNGFKGYETFDPLETSTELIELFENNPEFQSSAIFHYQITQSAKLLNVKINSIDATINRYNEGLRIKNSFEQKYGPDCWPHCKASQIIDFRDSGNDLDLLCAYIAIKSLIGQKRYIATTRNVILMRMLGCKSNKALQDFIKSNKPARELYNKYSRSDKALRYNFEKLFENLLSNRFIKSKIFERKISRKIFISAILNYDELADEIINFSKLRDHKKNENEALKKIGATI